MRLCDSQCQNIYRRIRSMPPARSGAFTPKGMSSLPLLSAGESFYLLAFFWIEFKFFRFCLYQFWFLSTVLSPIIYFHLVNKDLWSIVFTRECRNYHRNVIAGENDNWWRCGTGSVQFFRKVDLVVISCLHSAEKPLWQQLARAEWREEALDIFVTKYLEFVFRRHLQQLYSYFWKCCH